MPTETEMKFGCKDKTFLYVEKKMNLALEQDKKPNFLLSLNQLDALLKSVNLFAMLFTMKCNYWIGNW